MKVKSKISYLGERNSILPGQMAEQLSVEVDVKNVTHRHTDTQTHRRTRADICFRICIYRVPKKSVISDFKCNYDKKCNFMYELSLKC